MLCLAFVELAPLLVGVDVADDPVALGVLRDRLEPSGRDRADAMRRYPDLDAAHSCGPDSERVHPGQERLDVGVAEAALSRRRRKVPAVPAAAVIRRRKQHNRETGVDGGLGDGVRHRVRLVVRRTVGLVVDVVELADDGVAGADHLAVGLERDRAHRLRVERLREREHLGAPRPEVVVGAGRSGALGATAESSLERVGVRVRHPGDRDGRDGHENSLSARATTRAAIAASARSTCSAGEWLTPVSLRTNTIAAGTRSATTPASWPAKHTSSGTA